MNDSAGHSAPGFPLGHSNLGEARKPAFPVGDELGRQEIALPSGRFALVFSIDLAAAFESIGENPSDMFMEALTAAPDSAKLAAALAGRLVRFSLVEKSAHPFEFHEPGDDMAVNSAVFAVQDRILRRIVLQTGMVHQLRHAAEKPGANRESEKGLIKKDAGLFLLLLVKHSRKVFFLPRVLETVDGLFDPSCGFREILESFLNRLPFVLKEDPAESKLGLPYFNGNAFDALRFTDKIKVVSGGLLAWYSVLTLGAVGLFKPLIVKVTPFFGPATLILKASFREGFLLKKGFIPRAARAFFRGDFPKAVEFFWSGWNPVLARVAVRPAYRLFGGNARPLAATVATFLYTATIVHLMAPLALLLLGLRIASDASPGFKLGKLLGSDLNFKLILGAVCAYAFFGLLAGLSKKLRARRRHFPAR